MFSPPSSRRYLKEAGARRPYTRAAVFCPAVDSRCRQQRDTVFWSWFWFSMVGGALLDPDVRHPPDPDLYLSFLASALFLLRKDERDAGDVRGYRITFLLTRCFLDFLLGVIFWWKNGE